MSAQFEPVEAVAVIGALEYLADRNLSMCRRKFDQTVAKGKEPHPELVTRTERAEYLRDQARAAYSALGDLIEEARRVADGTTGDMQFLRLAIARVEPQS